MTKNWPIDSNHFNNSGNVYSLRRKYFFSDKNTDTFDVNNHFSRSAYSLQNFSSIREGLDFRVATSSSVSFGFGSFMHCVDGSVFSQPIKNISNVGYLSSVDHNSSTIHVGPLYDVPMQSYDNTKVFAFHSLVGLSTYPAGMSDPVYGTVTVDNPAVYLASDFGNDQDYRTPYISVTPFVANQINMSGLTAGANYDLYVDYTPDVTATWDAIPNQNYTVASGGSTTILKASASTFLPGDIGKWVTIRTGTYAGKKRQIVYYIDNQHVEIEALPGIPADGVLFYVHRGQALLPTLANSPRYDVIGIKKKTYEVKKNVQGVDSTGMPTVAPETARYFSTFQLVVQEGVIPVDGGASISPSTPLGYLTAGDFIPLGLVIATNTGITFINQKFPWISMFRERGLQTANLLANSSFETWPSTNPDRWTAVAGATITKGTPRIGSNSAKIVTTSAQNCMFQTGSLSQVGIHVGDCILFSAWMNSTVVLPVGRLRMVITSNSSNSDAGAVKLDIHSSDSIKYDANSSGFTTVTCRASIPVDAGIVPTDYIFFYIEALQTTGAGYFQVDDCVAFKIGSMYNGMYTASSGSATLLTGDVIVAGDLSANAISAAKDLTANNFHSYTGTLSAGGNWLPLGTYFYQDITGIYGSSPSKRNAFIPSFVDSATNKVVEVHDIETTDANGNTIRVWVTDNTKTLIYTIIKV